MFLRTRVSQGPEHRTVTDRVHYHPNLILSVGTQVVTLVDIPGSAGLVLHPRGTVGVIVKSPTDLEHSYRVRFLAGFSAPLKQSEVTMLARFKEGEIGDSTHVAQTDLYERVIYRCVIGSQAYGLADAESDVDRRGIYLPPADLHWSLYGVPEQLENHETQEAYWELQKFLVLALKANPNVLECLYTPLPGPAHRHPPDAGRRGRGESGPTQRGGEIAVPRRSDPAKSSRCGNGAAQRGGSQLPPWGI